jgi:LacI family repressor for deo operon, udp, cdd, tsx, nupC, and nupG
MAEAALMAIRYRGLRCPEDVGLLGFDDFRSAEVLTPPLSVVEQDAAGMGVKAVEVLRQRIEANEGTSTITLIPTRLVIRSSCGCSPRQV